MKKLLFICIALLTSAMASAQIQSSSDIVYKGGQLYMDGEKLSNEKLCEIYGEHLYNRNYKTGRSMRVSGIALTSVGGATLATGTYMFISGMGKGINTESVDDSEAAGREIAGNIAGGIFLVPTGVLIAGGGIALLCVGNKKIKNLAGLDNKKLALSCPKSGVGIALSF